MRLESKREAACAGKSSWHSAFKIGGIGQEKKSSKPPDTIFFFGFQTMICSLQKCLLSLMTVHISVANAHGDKPQTILNWAQLHNSSSFSPPPAQTIPSFVPLLPFAPPGSNPSLSDFLSPGDPTLPPLSTSTRPTSIHPIKFPTSPEPACPILCKEVFRLIWLKPDAAKTMTLFSGSSTFSAFRAC